MKLVNIKHLFFDLDHTLWDFDKNSALTFDLIFKDHNIPIALDVFLEKYVPINNNYWELYRNEKVTKEALRIGRLKDSFEGLDYKIDQNLIGILADKYIEHLPGFNHLLEDTVSILDYLKTNYSLHIITNGFQEIQKDKLINSQILDYFQTITTSEEAKVKKPHLKIFQIAFKKAKAKPEESLMIGDNFEADIIGAKNAGMQAIFFDYYKLNKPNEVPQIQKLKELKSYL